MCKKIFLKVCTVNVQTVRKDKRVQEKNGYPLR